ncbi:AEC family transporter [Promicromonospora sukumoe]|uniref:AEC family transporter n=1 Tax=Promicromonospora sukumoe TaxID=88382 RepID=UPI0003750123|nr:AEC family transporter [Promicromonospora sukumoe]
MTGVLLGFAIVLVLVGVGLVAAWLLPGEAHAMQRGIAPLVYYITNPALMFQLMSDADLGAVLRTYTPIALITAAATGLLYALVAGGLLRRPAGPVAAGAMASSYVNAGNIGVPIALYAVGTAAPVVSVLIAQLLVVAPVYLSVFAWCRHRAARAARFAEADADGVVPEGTSRSLGATLGRSLANPVTVATGLGLLAAAFSLDLPVVLAQPVEMLGAASVPLLLLLFGMSLRGQRPLGRDARAEVVLGTVLKSLVMPVLAWVVGRFLFGLDGLDLLGVVLMAALPTAQNVFLFAGHFRLATTSVRDITLLSMLLALPTSLLLTLLLG